MREAERPLVIADLAHALADLWAWGQPDATGEWWALVSWQVYGSVVGHVGNLHVNQSAWFPASTVQRSRSPDQHRLYRHVTALVLPPDPPWPYPAGLMSQHWHHHGPLRGPPPVIDGLNPIVGDPHPVGRAAAADHPRPPGSVR